MASDKQMAKWEEQALKINDNPAYVQAYQRYRQLAKRADQRLVELEALSHAEHFKGVKEFAYAKAIYSIRTWGGNRRFNIAPPKTLRELESKIHDIESFLQKPTSSKRQILKFYQQRADTINNNVVGNVGSKLTWQEVANYFERAEAEGRDVKRASKTKIQAIALIKQASFDKQKEQIKDTNEIVSRIDSSNSNNKVKEIAKRLLEQGLDYNKLIGDK